MYLAGISHLSKLDDFLISGLQHFCFMSSLRIHYALRKKSTGNVLSKTELDGMMKLASLVKTNAFKTVCYSPQRCIAV